MQTIRSISSVAALAIALALAPQALAQNLTRSLLFSSPKPSLVGQTVNLTAQVDGLGGGAPTGAVDFSDNGTALGASALVAQGAGQALLAMGHAHTCAISRFGGASCWGFNVAGQLGDGTTVTRSTAQSVVDLSPGTTALTAGRRHTCALDRIGGVQCWGYNGFGQLGDGTAVDRHTPVNVGGLGAGVMGLQAGGEHTCAIGRGGGLKCWGSNLSGELGDGTTTDRASPVNVVGLQTGVIALAAGGKHTCALTSAGRVKCWGLNNFGQLGDGSTTDRLTPMAVAGLTARVVAIAAGDSHTCAVINTGGVKCWGLNDFGQLGDGSTANRLTPVDVGGLTTRVVAVAAGNGHTCALTRAGGMKCWGSNFWGQLGDGTTTDHLTPADVVGLATGVVASAANHLSACAMTSIGSLKCWGANLDGQLGDGTSIRRLTPVDTLNLSTPVRAWAKFATSSLVAGTHVLRASYVGDAAHTGSTAATTQVVK